MASRMVISFYSVFKSIYFESDSLEVDLNAISGLRRNAAHSSVHASLVSLPSDLFCNQRPNLVIFNLLLAFWECGTHLSLN